MQIERQSQNREACSELGYGTPTRKQQLKGLRTLIVYEPHKTLICLMAKVLRPNNLNINILALQSSNLSSTQSEVLSRSMLRFFNVNVTSTSNCKKKFVFYDPYAPSVGLL